MGEQMPSFGEIRIQHRKGDILDQLGYASVSEVVRAFAALGIDYDQLQAEDHWHRVSEAVDLADHRGQLAELDEALHGKHIDFTNVLDEQQLSILQSGPSEWNQYRERNPGTLVRLSGAQLYGADLRGANLSRSNLSHAYFYLAFLQGARLERSNLFMANLSFARLQHSVLNDAQLVDSNLTGANLGHASLAGADLRGAHLQYTVLERADLAGTTLGGSVFANVDLSTVTGLDTAYHVAPSTVGIDTIYRSKGCIPEVFFRGAGVPDQFITYARSLVGQAVEYYSCFISDSSQDQDFADRLYADLQNSNVRCWFAPRHMRIGDRTRVAIDRAIGDYDKLLLILSEASITSQWVEQEVERALQRERDIQRLVLFPIRIDDAVMDEQAGWVSYLRNTRHIGDFRQWKDHDSYQESFTHLLSDLKAGGA